MRRTQIGKYSVKMAPDIRSNVCKWSKGSRLLCLQDFVSITITGVQNSRWKVVRHGLEQAIQPDRGAAG